LVSPDVRRTLVSMALTCRSFRDAAKTALDHSPTRWTSGPSCHPSFMEQGICLLRTLRDWPDVAEHIRSLEGLDRIIGELPDAIRSFGPHKVRAVLLLNTIMLPPKSTDARLLALERGLQVIKCCSHRLERLDCVVMRAGLKVSPDISLFGPNLKELRVRCNVEIRQYIDYSSVCDWIRKAHITKLTHFDVLGNWDCGIL
jgi:hypothetical protein